MLSCQVTMAIFCFCKPKIINLICNHVTYKLEVKVMFVKNIVNPNINKHFNPNDWQHLPISFQDGETQ
jgi:hypothetical protein